MSRHPEIVWAQRSGKLFLTIELPDAKNPLVKLEPEGKLKFSASAGDHKYELELELYSAVNVEASKISTGSRQIIVVVEKAEEGWWPRLVKSGGRAPPYIKVDWNKWVDEDEEHESKIDDIDMGGLGAMGDDFSNFDMGGNEADSDDEDPEMLPEANNDAAAAPSGEKTDTPPEVAAVEAKS